MTRLEEITARLEALRAEIATLVRERRALVRAGKKPRSQISLEARERMFRAVALRKAGATFTAIAAEIGVSVGTATSYCKKAARRGHATWEEMRLK